MKYTIRFDKKGSTHKEVIEADNELKAKDKILSEHKEVRFLSVDQVLEKEDGKE